jgi:hypothetical protein
MKALLVLLAFVASVIAEQATLTKPEAEELIQFHEKRMRPSVMQRPKQPAPSIELTAVEMQFLSEYRAEMTARKAAQAERRAKKWEGGTMVALWRDFKWLVFLNIGGMALAGISSAWNYLAERRTRNAKAAK